MKNKKRIQSNLLQSKNLPNLPKDNKKTTSIPQYNSDTLSPVWAFGMIDRNGPFAFDTNRQDFDSKLFIEKLVDFSKMKWADIMRQTHDQGKSSNHFLDLDGISQEAKNRYEFMQFSNKWDDQVFSFRFNNITRVIGIRKGQIFHVVWYDAKHNFYPSNKKNT